ncbi:MAG: hypothetical protein ACRDOE_19390, partial [Streptosporangiaceae bacterium]
MPAETPAPPAREAASWAAYIDRLTVERRPGVHGSNVHGHRLAGPVQGFGQMWRKTYCCDIGGVASPERVIEVWRGHFGEFWPKGSAFAAGLDGIRPGEVALIDIGVARGAPKVSTGVLVLYADDTSFTFMTPQGHQFAGWITFSAGQAATGRTQIQVEVLIRASDPLYEAAMMAGAGRREDRFWEQTVSALARHLGAEHPVVTGTAVCVDPRRQWRRWTSLWHNAAIRSVLQ